MEEFNNFLIILIIFFGIFLFVIISITANYFLRKKRTVELSSFARSRGYNFKEIYDPNKNLQNLDLSQIKDVKFSSQPQNESKSRSLGKISFFGFPIFENWPINTHPWLSAKIFNLGYSKEILNYFEKINSSEEERIFDYKYVIRSGKSSRTVNQTIIVFKIKKVLPKFLMEREGIFAKIIDFVGFKDIDFDNNVDFSKKWRLVGPDEKEIRQVFNQNVLNRLSSSNYFKDIESCENYIIFYSNSISIKVSDLNKSIEEARIISSMFY